jgi:hypothetical protein
MKTILAIVVVALCVSGSVYAQRELEAQRQTSPDGKWVVFVKLGHGSKISTGAADDIARGAD